MPCSARVTRESMVARLKTPPSPVQLAYCCTTPLPSGNGNINSATSAPLFTDLLHLAAICPCRGAGSHLDDAGQRARDPAAQHQATVRLLVDRAGRQLPGGHRCGLMAVARRLA